MIIPDDVREAALCLTDWWWPDMAHDPLKTERLVHLVANFIISADIARAEKTHDLQP